MEVAWCQHYRLLFSAPGATLGQTQLQVGEGAGARTGAGIGIGAVAGPGEGAGVAGGGCLSAGQIVVVFHFWYVLVCKDYVAFR